MYLKYALLMFTFSTDTKILKSRRFNLKVWVTVSQIIEPGLHNMLLQQQRCSLAMWSSHTARKAATLFATTFPPHYTNEKLPNHIRYTHPFDSMNIGSCFLFVGQHTLGLQGIEGYCAASWTVPRWCEEVQVVAEESGNLQKHVWHDASCDSHTRPLKSL